MRESKRTSGVKRLEKISIQRSGSYLYARSYLKIVAAVTLVYAAMGATLAVIAELKINSLAMGIIIFVFALGPVSALWIVYLILLRYFKLESRRAVELNDDGIRESRDGREIQFMPWTGVKEIELDATIGAGASLRVRGSFTEIVISNIDLVISAPSNIRRMHRSLAQMSRMRKLFDEIKAAAPHASLKMNELARRRLKLYGWAAGDAARH